MKLRQSRKISNICSSSSLIRIISQNLDFGYWWFKSGQDTLMTVFVTVLVSMVWCIIVFNRSVCSWSKSRLGLEQQQRATVLDPLDIYIDSILQLTSRTTIICYNSVSFFYRETLKNMTSNCIYLLLYYLIYFILFINIFSVSQYTYKLLYFHCVSTHSRWSN